MKPKILIFTLTFNYYYLNNVKFKKSKIPINCCSSNNNFLMQLNLWAKNVVFISGNTKVLYWFGICEEMEVFSDINWQKL